MSYSSRNMRPVSSWGRLGAPPHDVVELTDRDTVAASLGGRGPGIAYGLGRSYGDAYAHGAAETGKSGHSSINSESRTLGSVHAQRPWTRLRG